MLQELCQVQELARFVQEFDARLARFLQVFFFTWEGSGLCSPGKVRPSEIDCESN